MNHSAAELFATWYNKGVNKEAPPEELTIRRKALEKMLKNTDKVFWVKALKVFLGLSKIESADFNELLESAREGDENFSLHNDHLVRLICGCAIAQKIEANDSWISDLLALGILTCEFTGSSDIIPEIHKRAYEFWISSCENKKSLDEEVEIKDTALKSTLKIELPDLAEHIDDPKPYSTALIKVISSLQKDLNSSNTEINTVTRSLRIIKDKFDVLSEEVNILWWLFGAFSSTLEKPFNKLSPQLLSIIVALELNQKTILLPGIGAIDSLTYKALSHVDYETGTQFTISDVVSSIIGYEDGIRIAMPQDNNELIGLTPFIFAIKNHIDFAEQEWKVFFRKHINLNLEMKISLPKFSTQLYRELRLLDLYNEC